MLYEQSSLDGLAVDAKGSTLDFIVHRHPDTATASLDRDAVLSLIQVLTEWAYPTHTSEGPSRSLIEELIAKAVKDQVAAVLPLHLSPVACTHGGFCRDANGVQVIQCPEPDPGDVGHPRPVALRCGGCGVALPLGRDASMGHPCVDDPEPGDVGHPRPPAAEDGPCADCGHGKDRHRPVCAVFEAGKGVCRCNAYKAPLPVREKTVIVPECGLCKQPWSDGHGQPGDPCPGVEAARSRSARDWTDALWRVQPSAPADGSRYCDECGHSWESYRPELGKCASIVGKSVCGCFARPE